MGKNRGKSMNSPIAQQPRRIRSKQPHIVICRQVLHIIVEGGVFPIKIGAVRDPRIGGVQDLPDAQYESPLVMFWVRLLLGLRQW